ncbi:MAG: methyltransferase domain-containing protein [Chitinophagaceae bacterium]|nr:methyltransferase domain-containing protein [Chitinophagaceae bacterium]
MDKIQMAVSVFDKNAQHYQDKYMNLELYDDTYDFFCAQLSSSNAAVLDIACGPGNISRYLLRRRPELRILGIDLAPAMLVLAQQNCPEASFRLMDCREIGRLETKFDGIICGFGLPYLSQEDAVKLIRDAHDLLHPGGILYLSTMEDDYSKSGSQTSSATGDTLFMYFHEKGHLQQALAAQGFSLLSVQNKDFTTADGTVSKDLVLIARKAK